MDATIWPFAALRVTTPRLELRYPDDDDLVALAHLAAEGIHDPASMPFDEWGSYYEARWPGGAAARQEELPLSRACRGERVPEGGEFRPE